MTNRLTFKFNWKLTVFVLLFFPILVSLGFWQLDRAADKYQSLKDADSKQKLTTENLDTILKDNSPLSSLQEDLSNRKIRFRGHYLNDKNILIDNQIYQGQFGYEVITPFQLSSSPHIVLVSRGWVPGSLDRSIFPEITTIESTVELRAQIYIPRRKPYLIGELEKQSSWPKRLTFIDFEALQSEFPEPLFPYVVRLEADTNGVYERHWRSKTGLKPQNHQGYAFQWFALAATLLLCYIAVSSNIFALIRPKTK